MPDKTNLSDAAEAYRQRAAEASASLDAEEIARRKAVVDAQEMEAAATRHRLQTVTSRVEEMNAAVRLIFQRAGAALAMVSDVTAFSGTTDFSSATANGYPTLAKVHFSAVSRSPNSPMGWLIFDIDSAAVRARGNDTVAERAASSAAIVGKTLAETALAGLTAEWVDDAVAIFLSRQDAIV